MACSKYLSTKETTHSARVSRLLVDLCTDLFRDILKNNVTEIQFPLVLQREQSILIPILNKAQRENLFPRSGSFIGTYQEFDLSLLYILLRNVSGIKPHKKGWSKSPDPLDRSLSANIDRIREIRNAYFGHAARTFITDVQFHKLWQNLTIIIKELEKSLPGGCTTYSDAANMIKYVTMDPEQEKMFLDIIDQCHHTIEDLKDTLSNTEREIVFENTNAVLMAHRQKVIIRTTGVQTTINKLRESHIVILTGKGGTGKTTTAYQIMCEMSDPSLESPYTPVLIKYPNQWDKIINSSYRYIVYLDDIFGLTNLDTGAVEKWQYLLDMIFSCAKVGNIRVLIGLRKNILDEVRICCAHAILQDENIVDISSVENFTMKDKADMLDAYEKSCSFKVSEQSGDLFSDYTKKNGFNAFYKFSEYQKMVMLNANPYYGFPLTCFQFFSRRDFFQLGPSYFHHPDERLFQVIEDMRRSKCGKRLEKVKYCVLCYVFINGMIDTINISETMLKNICKKLMIVDTFLIDIKDALNDLNGLFLSHVTNHRYAFSHESILETVMVSFGQIAPEIVIKHCSRRKLRELIRTQNYKPRLGEVVLKISRHYYEELAQRLLRGDNGDSEEVKNISLVAFNIIQYPGCNDSEFVSVFCNRKMSDRLSLLFHCVFEDVILYSFFKNTVLLQELLERYGPHHNSPTSHMKEPNFQISVQQIENVLKDVFVHYDKLALSIILTYICRYRNHPCVTYVPCLRGLLHMKIHGSLTVLHHCTIHGWADLVEVILQMHKPTKTNHNWSVLHLAAYAGRPLLLKRFIDLGVDMTERTSEGFSVLQAALLGVRYGNQDISFPSHTANYVSFSNEFAIISLSFPESKEFETSINMLLTKPAEDIRSDLSMIVDEFKNNIVHYLVMHNYSDILDCLLKYGKEFLSHRNSSALPTALHTGVYLGRREIVEKLWKLGLHPQDSELSLKETLRNGEKFCNKQIFYSKLKNKKCWNDGDREVLDVKLKAIEQIKIAFGDANEFQGVRDFFLKEKLF
ncbi:uncharacterized protein LOC134281557 [Saccostrea cucullata]|uniref:uncharacterized protein LOC134281557 n=1 Tax=Saccostrea cuccullata TaxID=36930 RepID=UPI002ED06ED6